jgi:hypothetical protein
VPLIVDGFVGGKLLAECWMLCWLLADGGSCHVFGKKMMLKEEKINGWKIFSFFSSTSYFYYFLYSFYGTCAFEVGLERAVL